MQKKKIFPYKKKKKKKEKALNGYPASGQRGRSRMVVNRSVSLPKEKLT